MRTKNKKIKTFVKFLGGMKKKMKLAFIHDRKTNQLIMIDEGH